MAPGPALLLLLHSTTASSAGCQQAGRRSEGPGQRPLDHKLPLKLLLNGATDGKAKAEGSSQIHYWVQYREKRVWMLPPAGLHIVLLCPWPGHGVTHLYFKRVWSSVTCVIIHYGAKYKADCYICKSARHTG